MHTLSLADQNISGRISVEHLTLGSDVDDLHTELNQVLGFYPDAQSTLEILRTHYQAGNSLSTAFSGTIRELFKEYGLLVFNPRRSQVQDALSPLYRRTIEEHARITELLNTRSRELSAIGHKEQVRIRRDSPLVFFHPKGGAGPRDRLLADDAGAWTLSSLGTRIETADIYQQMQNDSLSISSSALLRPIIQDFLFPTAVYIGGRAELAYHEQISSLYPFFSLVQPIIIQRPSFTILDKRSHQWLAEFGLSIRDFEKGSEHLLSKLASHSKGEFAAPEELRRDAAAALDASLKPLKESIMKLDSTLEKPLAKTESKMLHLLEGILTRYTKALALRDETSGVRTAKLQALIAPSGVMQERAYCTGAFIARFGLGLLSDIYENIDLTAPEFKEIVV